MAEGRAPARAALAGNPSDGYGGAVLAVALPMFEARAVVAAGVAPLATPAEETLLADAAVARFRREFRVGSAVAVETTVPRCVGLGGSSAIVIAVLRALCAEHGIVLEPDAMASLALSIEVDDLGIAAGLQDRVAQCYGGLTFMEFAGEAPRYQPLDTRWLPPLLIAWRPAAAESSAIVHGDLRRRYDAGEPAVRQAIVALGGCAREARVAIITRDELSLRRAVDATFDLRAGLVGLNPRHVEMVEIARSAGAAANYTGSGGAIVCVCHDARHRAAVATALEAAGCETAYQTVK